MRESYSELLYKGAVTMEENLSMKDFDNEINNSFKKLVEGDIVKATVVAVGETEVTVDLNYYTQGIIPMEEISNNPGFQAKDDLTVGDEIDVMVMDEDVNEGNIIVPKKKADDIIAWDVLKEAYFEKKTLEVKVQSTTNGGVLTYLEGVRGFIPASQLSMNYVENLEEYVGKTLKARIITLEVNNKKLVLSAKEIQKEQSEADKAYKIANLKKDTIVTGVVETIMPYGVFVDIGDGVSGLVHISQICEKHIKSPNEVLKKGDKVTAKIINVKDGKVSLSIKACMENEVEEVEEETESVEYISNESASTSLSSLLDGLKF